MKTITAMQFKGGAGKTTTLMALASAAVNSGERIIMFDTDQNAPLERWRKSAIDNGAWNEAVEIQRHLDFQSLYDAQAELEDADTHDFLLIDARGGRSEFLTGVAQICDLIIVPCKLSRVDVDAMIETFQFLKKLKAEAEQLGEYRMLYAGVKPDNQLSVGMKAMKDTLAPVPQFNASLYDRVIYQNMQSIGLLGEAANVLRASEEALRRGQARSYQTALKEALRVWLEIEDQIMRTAA